MVLLILIIIVLAYFSYTKDEEIGRLKRKNRKLQKDNKILKEYIKRFINNPNSENVTSEFNQIEEVHEQPKVVKEESVSEPTARVSKSVYSDENTKIDYAQRE